MISPSLVLMLVVAASAPLTEDPDFIRAQAMYADLEFEGAMNALKRSAARPYSEQERAQLEVWMGMCSAQLRDELGVRAHFAQAVALDIDVQVPGFAPPKVAEVLEEARAEQQTRLDEQPAAPDNPPDAPPNDSPGDPSDDVGEEETVEGDPVLSTNEEVSVAPWVTAGALGAGAVVCTVAAAAMATGGFGLATLSTDPDQFQDEAAQLAVGAIALYAAAGAVGVVMVGLAAGAGGSVAWALLE